MTAWYTVLIQGTGTPKRSILTELNRENGAARNGINGNGNPPLANSPRAQHSSLEGGLDNLVLLNLSTPPSAAAAAAATDGSKVPAAAGSDAAAAPFERTGNKNRASERYHIPHKKAAKDQGAAVKAEEDKENFATPETPRSVIFLKYQLVDTQYLLYMSRTYTVLG